MVNQPSKYDVLTHAQKDELRSLLKPHVDAFRQDNPDIYYVERFIAEVSTYLCGATSAVVSAVHLPHFGLRKLYCVPWCFAPGETLNVNLRYYEGILVTHNRYLCHPQFRKAAREIMAFLGNRAPARVDAAHADRLAKSLDMLDEWAKGYEHGAT